MKFPERCTHWNAWPDPVKQYQSVIYYEAMKYVRGRGVAIDAGGHVGIFTRRMEDDFDRVYAFEPNPENFRCLAANTTKARLFNCCLWDAHLMLDMRLEDHPNSGAPEVTGVGTTHLAVPLDSFGIEKCDLIKMDVQGSEIAVLRGAQRLLESKPVILTERWQNDPRLEAYLTGIGYRRVVAVNKDEVWIP